MTESDETARAARDSRWLRASVAAVWLITGASVVHPFYWSVGAGYLGKIGLPVGLMPATCVAEIILGIWVLVGPATGLLTTLQAGMVLTFTAILAVAEPMLLVSPFGVLSKNLPLLAALAAAWELEVRGWTPRARRALRLGVAFIWLSEGLLPKIFFQQTIELSIAERTGLSLVSASALLVAIGLGQALSGAASLVLRGRPLVALWGAQAAALLLLPLWVGYLEPWLWVHPFGPFSKNLPILASTLVLMREEWRSLS
jgi:hypothetical protein